jgi:O-antigen/teichoic acid export membrane protein
MQFSMMVIAQANFLSGKTIFSESIRSIGFLVLGFLLLRWIKIDFVYALFIASISAFSMSVLYLKMQTTNSSELTSEAKTTPKQIIQLAQQFFKYGAPLSLWFVVVYVYAYIDKIAMLKYFGANIQGNYQAMFDLLSKGFTLIISPVLISLFPIITLAYKEGKQADIKNLIRKIILYEILGYALVSIGYFWFGANILLQILSVPNETIFIQLGFIIITGTFIWQIAMVVNKIFELQMKSLQMLYAAIITLLLQLLYYFFIRNTNSPLMISLGYLFASVSYLFTLLVFILFSSNNSSNKL